MKSSFLFILLLSLFALVVVSSPNNNKVDAQTAAGTPYLDFTIRDLQLPYIYSINEQNYLYSRILANMSNGFLQHKAGSLNFNTFRLEFKAQNVPNLRFITYFDTPDVDHILGYEALTLLRTNIIAGLFLPLFTHVSSFVVENPLPSGSIGLQPLYSVYKNLWSPLLKVWTSTTPLVGRTLVVDIEPVIASVSTDKYQVEIFYPNNFAYFRINGGPTPTTSGMVLQINTTASTEDTSRWNFDSTAFLNTITVMDYDTFFVTAPPSGTRAYDGQPQNIFKVRANSFWRPTIDAIVTPVVTPSTGVVISPVNVSIVKPFQESQFTIAAPPGTYNVSFVVPPAFTGPDGYDIATDNDKFHPITTTVEITVLPTLNLVVSAIADSYMPAPPEGTWGGAWSDPITVTLEDTAVSDLTISLDTSFHGSDVEMYPSSFTFNNVNLANQTTFRLRALTTGVKTIQFVKSGTNSGDFVSIPSQAWTVSGPNPACAAETVLANCYALNGCAFDATAGSCSDVPLNITVDSIPLLYAGETSSPIFFHLPTPVQSDLTIELYADNRFTFVPTTLTLSAGAVNASFQIVGQMDIFDDRVNVLQEFTGYLTGSDSVYYYQPTSSAYIRPAVDCLLVPPQFFLYPEVESHLFSIQCDQAPETDVTFTMNSVSGVTLSAVYPDPGGNPLAVYFSPANTTMNFTLTGTIVKSFTLTFTLGGTNSARYNALNTMLIRVINKGYVLPPASFRLPQYETTVGLHLDLSSIQIEDTIVNVTIYNATTLTEITPSTDGIHLIPNQVQFPFNAGDVPRQTLQVRSNLRGSFLLRFAIDGPGAIHYHDPTVKDDVHFDVVDPWEGSAFKYYQTFDRYASDAKRACRLNHGYRSMDFDGQNQAVHNSDLCQALNFKAPTIPPYNCSQHESRYRCHWALETARYACAWVNNSCYHVAELDGNITSFTFGETFTAFVDNMGQVWTIGDTTSGQLGHVQGKGVLGRVELGETIDGVAAGSHFMLAISSTGRLYTWGENLRGELGQNTFDSYKVVYGEITLPRGENATCISAGSNHAGAVTLSGKTFMWGSNQYGQLGSPETYGNHSRSPVRVRPQFIGSNPVITMHCGARYTAIVTATTGWTFGANSMGQLAREGFDEWRPAPMVFYNSSNPLGSAPNYLSWIRC